MTTQRDLQDIFNSGEVTQIKIGGVGTKNRVVTFALLEAEELEHLTFQKVTSITVPYEEGTIFYDTDTHSISFYTDIPGVTLNIPQEQVVRVVNKTGFTIPNGTPVYLYESFNNLPSVAIGDASLLSTAILVGVATHDIANDAQGFVTRSGVVNDIDLSTFAVNDSLFLQEGGGLGLTIPRIATRVGKVLNNGVNGKLLVEIENNIALPFQLGLLSDISTTPLTITATPQTIVNFINSETLAMTVDKVAGTIRTGEAGYYRGTLFCTCSFTSAVVSRKLYFELFDVTAGTSFKTAIQPIPRDVNENTFSVSVTMNLPKEHIFRCQVSSDATFNNVIFSTFGWDLQSVFVR